MTQELLTDERLAELDGSELWEIVFGVFEGDVPDELTDEKLSELASAINEAFPRRQSPSAEWQASPIELRPDDKGEFDELVARGASVHMEMMDDNCLWIAVEVGSQRLAVWIRSKKPLTIWTEDQSGLPTPNQESEHG